MGSFRTFFSGIPKNVFILGVVSLFNDISSEMIYPIVPIFLTSVLGVPVSVVGLIEGIAEGTASLMKFLAGYLSDKVQKRKIFVVFGYSFSSVAKLLIALAQSWGFVLFARFIDRFGKGVRTSARDALLLQSTNQQNRGFLFGFHRALDSAGAVIGPLLALVLLSVLSSNMRLIFLIAFIPGAIGVLLLVFFVKERKEEFSKKLDFHFNWKTIDQRFLFFLLVSVIFSLGNSSDAFLILRAKALGGTTIFAVLVYVLYNLSQTIFATPAGKLADKFGAKNIYSVGLVVFSLVYLLFGLVQNPSFFWLLFPLYGIYIAATDGVSKAYVSEFMKQEQSGTYFGLYQTGIAIASFLASFIGGLLWTAVSPSATFFYGSIAAALAFFILLLGKPKK